MPYNIGKVDLRISGSFCLSIILFPTPKFISQLLLYHLVPILLHIPAASVNFPSTFLFILQLCTSLLTLHIHLTIFIIVFSLIYFADSPLLPTTLLYFVLLGSPLLFILIHYCKWKFTFSVGNYLNKFICLIFLRIH